MSRMTTPAEADIPAAARPALAAAARQLGSVPNKHRALAASPKALNAWLDLRKAMSTSLDAATRQGIAHAVDEINGCDYCDAMHTRVSEQMTRLDEDEIVRNRAGSSNNTRRVAALAFARALALTRGNVDDGALDAVRGKGFTDGQILEIVALVVQFTMSNYFNNVMKPISTSSLTKLRRRTADPRRAFTRRDSATALGASAATAADSRLFELGIACAVRQFRSPDIYPHQTKITD